MITSEIMQAMKMPKIGMTEKQNIFLATKSSIAAAFSTNGQRASAADLKIYADDLTKLAMTRFPYLTLEELRIAMEKGAHGDYGDYFGLSPKTFSSWLGIYVESEERRNAKNAFEREKTQYAARRLGVDAKAAERMNRNTQRKWAWHSWQYFLRFGNLPTPAIGTVGFDIIWRYYKATGLVTEDEAAMRQAKAKALKLLNERKRRTPFTTIGGLLNFADQKVENAAKAILIAETYRQLAAENKEPNFGLWSETEGKGMKEDYPFQ